MDGVQAEMLQRITRVETTVDNMNEKLDNAIAINETAVKALASARSAHLRLDRIEEGQRWLWRTLATSVITIVVGAIIFVIKMGGA